MSCNFFFFLKPRIRSSRIRMVAMVAALVLASAGSCFADLMSVTFAGSSVSLTGQLLTDGLPDANAVQLFSFAVTGPDTITLQSWSYGGGTNAAGQAIAPGGFLLDLALFGPVPGNPLLWDSQQTWTCPPGNADGNGICGDVSAMVALDAGTYTLAIMADPNYPLLSLSDGFNGGGSFIRYDGEQLTPFFAVDITGSNLETTAVPEPGTLGLLAAGAAAMFRRKHRTKS